MFLHNRVDRKVLKEAINSSPVPRNTISFYKYFDIPNPSEYRDMLYLEFNKLEVLGRIYLAEEGINAQISVPAENLDAFQAYLYSLDHLDQTRLNVAVEDDGKSFYKLQIKVRKKIVADGIDDPDFNPSNTGNYLSAEAFNKLTDQEETVLIDMRNHYESEVGHFKGAICADVDTFREQLPAVTEMLEADKDKNVVMYCTGGIRCEKASAYFKHKGYENVYHLEGGIIKYANDAKRKGLKNKFIGKNFVFDERLGERISDDIIANCHQCGVPCDTHINCANEACHLLFIQCSTCAEKYHHCCSDECKDFIALPLDEQKRLRKGMKKHSLPYNKGRIRPKLMKVEGKFIQL